MRIRKYLCIASVALTSTANAQASAAWTVDLQAGNGAHTTRAGATYYDSDRMPALRVAAGRQFDGSHGWQTALRAEYSMSVLGDGVAICKPAPNGTCQEPFEDADGIGITFALRRALTSRVALGGAIGAGHYGQHMRALVDGEASLQLGAHIATIVTTRYSCWRHAGTLHWFAPITAGLRVF